MNVFRTDQDRVFLRYRHILNGGQCVGVSIVIRFLTQGLRCREIIIPDDSGKASFPVLLFQFSCFNKSPDLTGLDIQPAVLFFLQKIGNAKLWDSSDHVGICFRFLHDINCFSPGSQDYLVHLPEPVFRCDIPAGIPPGTAAIAAISAGSVFIRIAIIQRGVDPYNLRLGLVILRKEVFGLYFF